jgi:hypothetical protein
MSRVLQKNYFFNPIFLHAADYTPNVRQMNLPIFILLTEKTSFFNKKETISLIDLFF